VLGTNGVLVVVDEPPAKCATCGGLVRLQKTVERNGVTLEHGAFRARESIYICAAGCRAEGRKHATHRAPTLARRIQPGHTVGYDVMVHVGLARFVDYRQRDEIRRSLQIEHGISLSSGEISDLARDFLRHLARLHHDRAPHLRYALESDGGWPLHVDATGEDGRGTLLVALTGWRRWVLGAWKIPTERADAVLPRLLSVTEMFGAPCAIVRDLGRAMTEAAESLVRHLRVLIPVLACHQHFLGDVGSDLLEGSHDSLRLLVRQFKVRAALGTFSREIGRGLGPDIVAGREALRGWQDQAAGFHQLPEGTAGLACVRAVAQWVLDFTADGEDQGFPYDRPYLDFYDRGHATRRAIDAFLRHPPSSRPVENALRRLARVLDPLIRERAFAQAAKRLRMRAALFDKLRQALRLTPKPDGRNMVTPSLVPPAEAAAEIQDIQKAVRRLSSWLKTTRPARGPAEDRREATDILLRHLKDHGKYLWGHAVQLRGDRRGEIRVVDRTNNIEEGLFRQMKHGERRRSGRKTLTQDLEHLPAAAALAVNLKCPDYVELLCGSLARLPEAFADLNQKVRRDTTVGLASARAKPEQVQEVEDLVSASLPTIDRRLVRSEGMRARIVSAGGSRAPVFHVDSARLVCAATAE
jgi:hypothetical protein